MSTRARPRVNRPGSTRTVALQLLGILCAVSPQWQGALALDNGLALTPPMGFSDSCLGGGETTRLNQSQITDMARKFNATGLFALGYSSINLDDSWELFNRSADGALQPDPNKFPRGISPVAAELHRMGMSLGVYTSDAERSCKYTAGSLYHEQQDTATLAGWDIDFLKVDNCGEVNLNSFAKYTVLRDALNKTGRRVVYSCEPHVQSAIGWLPAVCNQWRTTSDNCRIAFSFAKLVGVLYKNNFMAANAGPGGWNDLDPVMVGTGTGPQAARAWGTHPGTPLTLAEARSHFTMYAVVKSPLLLAADPTLMAAPFLDLLRNAEIIAINQDPLGLAAIAVGNNTPPSRLPPHLAGGTHACPARAPEPHQCCDHPHCKARNESECLALHCCYGGQKCWRQGPPSPPSPSPPSPPPAPKPTHFELVTSCQWRGGNRKAWWHNVGADGFRGEGAAGVSLAQQWSLSASGQIVSKAKGLCLTAFEEKASVAFRVALTACRPDGRGQTFGNLALANTTIAQIFLPPTIWAAEPRCLGTDGQQLLAVACATEDPACKLQRCAHSVLANQLWHINMDGQLLSTYTDTVPPPLLSGWGPNDLPLQNVPRCIASAANPSPPHRIPQPPRVLVDPQTANATAQQVWAGPLAGDAWVLVLWNTGAATARITAWWEQVGIAATQTCRVRDLWAHRELAPAAGNVSFEVASHDVMVLKLSSCN